MREKPYTVKEFFEKVKEKICNEGTGQMVLIMHYQRTKNWKYGHLNLVSFLKWLMEVVRGFIWISIWMDP